MHSLPSPISVQAIHATARTRRSVLSIGLAKVKVKPSNDLRRSASDPTSSASDRTEAWTEVHAPCRPPPHRNSRILQICTAARTSIPEVSPEPHSRGCQSAVNSRSTRGQPVRIRETCLRTPETKFATNLPWSTRPTRPAASPRHRSDSALLNAKPASRPLHRNTN